LTMLEHFERFTPYIGIQGWHQAQYQSIDQWL
jgi:hypothetical protein